MSDAQRLEQIRERAAAAIKRDPSWQLLTDDIPWMDAAINRLLAVKDQRQQRIAALEAENARLTDAGAHLYRALATYRQPDPYVTGGVEHIQDADASLADWLAVLASSEATEGA